MRDPRQTVLHSPEFKALWDRIKHKTTYRVAFDNEDLLEKCARALREAPPMPRTRLQWRTADIAIGHSGVEATETAGSATVVLDEADIELPDVLQDRTQLTRRSIQHPERASTTSGQSARSLPAGDRSLQAPGAGPSLGDKYYCCSRPRS